MHGDFVCGIAGHIRFTEQPSAQHVAALVRGIRHRGPDDSGLWVSPGKECVLGHARLSIIDLSPLGHQPMVDHQTGNSLVFNGEIYNFQTLRKECEDSGDTFRSHSDTEVILALYRRHGVACLGKLRGMFAFALWDERLKSLFLARDRVGKKPLNYAVMKTGIAFCSELHPLSRHPGVDTGIDMEALELYLQLQFIPAPWSIYRGIRKLPPAHYALYDRNGLKIEPYWEIDYHDKIQISEADALDALEEKLTEAVRLRMIADVPLGALLSGGVDSSVVVALMAKLSKAPVNTFSIGFEEETFNELPWAQQAAERCGTLHHPKIVKGDVEDLLPKLARHYGEPFADHSAVPSFIVSAAARCHVTVALNGDGGDELLGGYSHYSLPGWIIQLSKQIGGLIPRALLADWAPRLIDAKTIPQRAMRKLLMQYANPELRSLMFASFWTDPERRQLLPDGPSLLLRDWRRSLLESAFAYADNPVERMLWMDNCTYLPDDLLVKMDIASMHCGLETRSPLLDHEVIEFCARLPVRYKVKDRVGKYLLKKLAERYFPVGFVHRRKMGFGIPLDEWLRGPLRRTLEGTLRDIEIMTPLDPHVIGKTLDEFLHHHVDHSCRLWALLMYGIWRKQQRLETTL